MEPRWLITEELSAVRESANTVADAAKSNAEQCQPGNTRGMWERIEAQHRGWVEAPGRRHGR